MPQSQHRGPPPTLPPPPVWRLIVAGLAIAGFLYFLYTYQTAVEERTAPSSSFQPAPTSGDGAPLRLANRTVTIAKPGAAQARTELVDCPRLVLIRSS